MVLPYIFQKYHILIGVLILGFLVGQFCTSCHEYLALSVLSKNYSSIYHLFTTLTAPYIETHLFFGVINIISTIYIAPYLCRIWGFRSYIKYVVLCGFWVCVLTYWSLFFYYTLTFNQSILYTQVCGFTGVTAASIMALMQSIPEKELLPHLHRFKLIQIKHLPFVFLITLFSSKFLFSIYGLYIGWVYLRFYRYDETTKLMGDNREEFSFDSFFPSSISPYISLLSSIVYDIALWFNLIKPSSSPVQYVQDTNTFGVVSDVTVERRRAHALKAIDDKLQALSAPQVPLPSLDDIESGTAENNN